MHYAQDENPCFRPCLILAHPDPAYAATVLRSFRQHGWDVYRARTGPEVRRLARMLDAEVVILDSNLAEESAWLTCDKLVREQPAIKVILIAAHPDAHEQRFAAFVGASALVNRADGVTALLRELHGVVLPAAG